MPVLKLIDDAQSIDSLKLSVQLLNLVKAQTTRNTDRNLTFQVLAEIFARRASLINLDVLPFIISLAIEQGKIIDEVAFRELLLSPTAWCHVALNVNIEILSSLRQLVTKTNASLAFNLKVLAKVGIVQYVLDVLHEDTTPMEVAECACLFLEDLFQSQIGTEDLAAIERFLVITCDRHFTGKGPQRLETPRGSNDSDRTRGIRMRNLLLRTLLRVSDNAQVIIVVPFSKYAQIEERRYLKGRGEESGIERVTEIRSSRSGDGRRIIFLIIKKKKKKKTLTLLNIISYIFALFCPNRRLLSL